MPFSVSRAKAPATASKGGNKRGGNRPRCATVSQIAPTTINGNALRAARRSGPASTVAEARTSSECCAISCMRETPTLLALRSENLRTAFEHRVAAGPATSRYSVRTDVIGTAPDNIGDWHGHEERPENRLDRHGTHGLSHGRAAAQGRP